MTRRLRKASGDEFARALPYVILVLLISFGLVGYFLSMAQQNTTELLLRQEAAERAAYEQCRSDNDTRMLVAEVLDTIAAPQRPNETQAQYEARISAFEEAKELLVLSECPIPLGEVRLRE